MQVSKLELENIKINLLFFNLMLVLEKYMCIVIVHIIKLTEKITNEGNQRIQTVKLLLKLL